MRITWCLLLLSGAFLGCCLLVSYLYLVISGPWWIVACWAVLAIINAMSMRSFLVKLREEKRVRGR